MPIGGFLDTFPSLLFVAVHLALFAIGIWAIWRANADRMAYAWAFGLYAVSQIAFLMFFAGGITLKLAVLIEQMLIVGLVIWVTISGARRGASVPR